MSSYHFGDKITQHGNNNIGVIKTSADPQAALRDAVAILRGQIAESDRRTLDESMMMINAGDATPRQSLRQALTDIAGIAAVVGQVGVPVVEAVRNVMRAFGF
jgi:hypothetical protein